MTYQRVEIVTGSARRRRWTLEEKLAFVEEARRSASSLADVARRHGVCRSLLFRWRRQAEAGELGPAETSAFVPVTMMPEPGSPTAVAPKGSDTPASARRRPTRDAGHPARNGLIEIEMPDGRRVLDVLGGR